MQEQRQDQAQGRERRQQPRLRLGQQDTEIRAQMIWPGESQDAPISFIDISRSGFGIQTAREFSVGDTLKLQVGLGEAEPVQLVAVICNCRGKGNDYRYGAYFEYDAAPDDEYAEEMLRQLDVAIRARLERRACD